MPVLVPTDMQGCSDMLSRGFSNSEQYCSWAHGAQGQDHPTISAPWSSPAHHPQLGVPHILWGWGRGLTVSAPQVVINPNFEVAESDFTNNAMKCNCKYDGHRIWVHSCHIGNSSGHGTGVRVEGNTRAAGSHEDEDGLGW